MAEYIFHRVVFLKDSISIGYIMKTGYNGHFHLTSMRPTTFNEPLTRVTRGKNVFHLCAEHYCLRHVPCSNVCTIICCFLELPIIKNFLRISSVFAMLKILYKYIY